MKINAVNRNYGPTRNRRGADAWMQRTDFQDLEPYKLNLNLQLCGFKR